jgi:hypothetical protein
MFFKVHLNSVYYLLNKLYMSFKQFFTEAVAPTFTTDIPGRAKFQMGDIVVVRETIGPGYNYAHYHSKKHLPYLNQIGEVVGYKNVKNAYTKFALKFSDNNVLLVHSQFLFGPFKDVATAQKYASNPKKQINSADLKTYVGADVPFASNPKIETYMKSFLAPLGYTWLAKPKIITEGKTVYTVFATKPILHTIKTELKPRIKGYFSFYRQNNAITKKLKTEVNCERLSSITRRGFRTLDSTHEAYGDWDEGICSYFVEAPSAISGYSVANNHKEFFEIEKFGIGSNFNKIEQNKDVIYGIFDAYNHIHTNETTDDYSVVSRLYKITEENGVKTIHGHIIYDALKLNDPYFFKDYNITGSFYIENRGRYSDSNNKEKYIVTQLTDFSFMPRSVRDLNLDLHFFPNIITTKGMPKVQKGIEIKSGNISKFEDMPDTLNGIFNVYNLKNLKSLAGCPNTINGNFTIMSTPITTLVGGPEVVTGRYSCTSSNIKNFVGAPKVIAEDYKESIEDKISNNGFVYDEGGFNGGHNEQLLTCEGAPETVYGNFNINGCKNLTSLEGSPKKIVGGHYDLGDCPKLKSLNGLTLDIIQSENYFKYSLGYKDNNFTLEDIEKYVSVQKLKQSMSSGAKETFGGLMDEL